MTNNCSKSALRRAARVAGTYGDNNFINTDTANSAGGGGGWIIIIPEVATCPALLLSVEAAGEQAGSWRWGFGKYRSSIFDHARCAMVSGETAGRKGHAASRC